MLRFQRQGALRRGTWKTALFFSTLEIYFGFWMPKGNVVSGNRGGGKNNQHQTDLSVQISTIAAD
jgi:hypothetical protein